jgi:hypothetical protein
MTDAASILMLHLGKVIDSLRVEGSGSIVRKVTIVMEDGTLLTITPVCYHGDASLVVERETRQYITPEELLAKL